MLLTLSSRPPFTLSALARGLRHALLFLRLPLWAPSVVLLLAVIDFNGRHDSAFRSRESGGGHVSPRERGSFPSGECDPPALPAVFPVLAPATTDNVLLTPGGPRHEPKALSSPQPTHHPASRPLNLPWLVSNRLGARVKMSSRNCRTEPPTIETPELLIHVERGKRKRGQKTGGQSWQEQMKTPRMSPSRQHNFAFLTLRQADRLQNHLKTKHLLRFSKSLLSSTGRLILG